MPNKFSAWWKMGKFPLLAANVFSESDKMFLEQFFAYMLCYFKKYASTLVICNVRIFKLVWFMIFNLTCEEVHFLIVSTAICEYWVKQ